MKPKHTQISGYKTSGWVKASAMQRNNQTLMEINNKMGQTFKKKAALYLAGQLLTTFLFMMKIVFHFNNGSLTNEG